MRKLSIIALLSISMLSISAMEDEVKNSDKTEALIVQDIRPFKIRSYCPPPPDYRVAVGDMFTIKQKESLQSDTMHYFDACYSNNDLFVLEQQHTVNTAPGIRTRYFNFRAIKKGTGSLNIRGERSQPEQSWQMSYLVVVE